MGMFGTKPAASLSSGLLARKGAAKPAMRPQGFLGGHTSLEDLGWNDMGDHLGDQGRPAPVEAIAPQTLVDAEAPVPPVLRQREALEQVAPMAVPAAPAAMVPPVARAAPAKGGKAAFTLRLDPDRHLRLRLASAVRNQSAQMLVTEALDAFLKTIPEADDLARQLPPAAR